MSLRIAMIGTRGVPANYGGFETAVEQVGRRLVERGHRILVYRRDRQRVPRLGEHLGMRTVTLPSINSKVGETLSHTGASVVHAVTRAKPDMAFVFNAANAPFLPVLRAAGIPVATHVDGLEWQRGKWGPRGRQYYLWAERRCVAWSDALIADAGGIARYYRDTYSAATELISYGAPILNSPGHDLLPEGLAPGGYHLVVARFEPENHVLEIVQGYHRSAARIPLAVVGGAPFAAEYTRRIDSVAAADGRIRLLGRVDHQDALDQLYGNALTYVHGHSVGGTNPSLLRAMGAAAQVLAFDVVFNREVAGADARYFTTPAQLAELLEQAERDIEETLLAGKRLQARAAERYVWDDVADRYEELALRLARR